VNFKFGIIGCFYNCADYLPEVLPPWFKLKKEFNLEMTAVNCLFTEYAAMGMKNEDSKTRDIIKSFPFDYTFISPIPQHDSIVRNSVLSYLLYKEVDFVWLLDGDEFYTEEEIRNIISFVIENKDKYWFSLNFKNYIFDGKTWVDGFRPPRIFNNTLNKKIDRFYWENDIVYSDGTDYKKLSNIEIPIEKARVRHMTWLNKNGKSKVEYQIKHYGHCSYKWNEIKQELEFDLDYYKKFGVPLPNLIKD
jgi:hypothetical protein